VRGREGGDFEGSKIEREKGGRRKAAATAEDAEARANFGAELRPLPTCFNLLALNLSPPARKAWRLSEALRCACELTLSSNASEREEQGMMRWVAVAAVQFVQNE
jgi:hypothetical protein